MQTASSIINLFVGLLPTFLLLLLVVLIYFRGKGGNTKLVKRNLLFLEEHFGTIVEEFTEVNVSASGFTYNCVLKKPKGEDDPLKYVRRMRVHFSLEDRHTLISWFLLLFKKPKDYLIIEADPAPTKNDHINLEIADWADLKKWDLDKLKEEWADLDDFEPKSDFSAKFFHKVNHPKALKFLYGKEPDIKRFVYNLPGLFRLSVKRKEAWGYRLAMRIGKKEQKNQLPLAREITLRFMRGVALTNQAIQKTPKRFLSA